MPFKMDFFLFYHITLKVGKEIKQLFITNKKKYFNFSSQSVTEPVIFPFQFNLVHQPKKKASGEMLPC